MKNWITLGCAILTGCGSPTFVDDRHIMIASAGKAKPDIVREAAVQGQRHGFSSFQIISAQDTSAGQNVYVAFYGDDAPRDGRDLYSVAEVLRR